MLAAPREWAFLVIYITPSLILRLEPQKGGPRMVHVSMEVEPKLVPINQLWLRLINRTGSCMLCSHPLGSPHVVYIYGLRLVGMGGSGNAIGWRMGWGEECDGVKKAMGWGREWPDCGTNLVGTVWFWSRAAGVVHLVCRVDYVCYIFLTGQAGSVRSQGRRVGYHLWHML